MESLPNDIQDSIDSLCEKGDDLCESGNFISAIKCYWEAWDLLPEPKVEWEASTWILAALGDAHFQNEDFEAGRNNLSMAMHCPNAIGNPFVHLRLGQCLFELGQQELAANELMRAYMADGPRVFGDEDTKYIEFLKSVAKDIEDP